MRALASLLLPGVACLADGVAQRHQSLVVIVSVSLLLSGFHSIMQQTHAHGKPALNKYHPGSNYFSDEQNPQDDRNDQRRGPNRHVKGRCPPSPLSITEPNHWMPSRLRPNRRPPQHRRQLKCRRRQRPNPQDRLRCQAQHLQRLPPPLSNYRNVPSNP